MDALPDTYKGAEKHSRHVHVIFFEREEEDQRDNSQKKRPEHWGYQDNVFSAGALEAISGPKSRISSLNKSLAENASSRYLPIRQFRI